ncbi:MAG: fatty acid desaturase [Gluconacetobacter diazotrophicus]|nr:fatty acid desaturase [Gluconacetobacter diazotrophicus]
MIASDPSRRSHLPSAIEWPSVALAACVYGGWIALTLCANALPWWAVLPAGAWLTAWHMSLQHEVIHGHPTPWTRVNDAIGLPPLSPWLPYRRYQQTHLGHHRGANLTDPVDDPESHYVSAAGHEILHPLVRALLRADNTLLGRITLGPLIGVLGFWQREARLLLAGNREVRRVWMWHVPAAAGVSAWLVLACHLSPFRYLMLFAYPGYALALVRSFAEHRAAEHHDHRTAVVEHAPILGLLFLHNNLHVVHHLYPGLPWYRIPAIWRRQRAALLRRNGGLLYRGYGEICRRYLLRQHDSLVHSAPRLPAVPTSGGS